jgi:hypothetical protein
MLQDYLLHFIPLRHCQFILCLRRCYISAQVPDFESAITAMTIASLALFLTGGYFVQNIPVFFSWIRYLSPFK